MNNYNNQYNQVLNKSNLPTKNQVNNNNNNILSDKDKLKFNLLTNKKVAKLNSKNVQENKKNEMRKTLMINTNVNPNINKEDKFNNTAKSAYQSIKSTIKSKILKPDTQSNNYSPTVNNNNNISLSPKLNKRNKNYNNFNSEYLMNSNLSYLSPNKSYRDNGSKCYTNNFKLDKKTKLKSNSVLKHVSNFIDESSITNLNILTNKENNMFSLNLKPLGELYGKSNNNKTKTKARKDNKSFSNVENTYIKNTKESNDMSPLLKGRKSIDISSNNKNQTNFYNIDANNSALNKIKSIINSPLKSNNFTMLNTSSNFYQPSSKNSITDNSMLISNKSSGNLLNNNKKLSSKKTTTFKNSGMLKSLFKNNNSVKNVKEAINKCNNKTTRISPKNKSQLEIDFNELIKNTNINNQNSNINAVKEINNNEQTKLIPTGIDFKNKLLKIKQENNKKATRNNSLDQNMNINYNANAYKARIKRQYSEEKIICDSKNNSNSAISKKNGFKQINQSYNKKKFSAWNYYVDKYLKYLFTGKTIKFKEATVNKHQLLENNIIGYACNINKGLIRNYNEDRIVTILNLPKPKNKITNDIDNNYWPTVSYFAIFDGHGGVNVSDWLSENLHFYIVNQASFPKDPKKAIYQGFKEAEETLLVKLLKGTLNIKQKKINTNDNYSMLSNSKKHDNSGSCAVIVMIIDKEVYVANVGDSRAILATQNLSKNYIITTDHKPDNLIEKKRIEENGGKLWKQENAPYRVIPGGLSCSRTFGDVEAKIKSIGGLPNVVSAEPDVFHFSVLDDHDFILLGCDGIFDNLTNKEIFEASLATFESETEVPILYTKQIYNSVYKLDNYHSQMGLIVDSIMRCCFKTLSSDNLSIILICFNNFKNMFDSNNLERNAQKLKHTKKEDIYEYTFKEKYSNVSVKSNVNKGNKS